MKRFLAVALRSILLCLFVFGSRCFAQVSFNHDVRPILSKHCLVCHGPDEADRQANLRVDRLEDATKDLGGYAAIVPGDPDESEIIVRVESEDDDRMPPPAHGHKLSESEIDTLKQWIEAGANYETHWSFVAPQKQPLPSTKYSDWPSNEIDYFFRHGQ